MKRTIFTAGVGAFVMYFFDPSLGRTRRAKVQQRFSGLVRRSVRDANKKTEYVRGQLEGIRHIASPDSLPASDEVLTDKIESEVLNRWNYPKGSINVNTAQGVVEIRGLCEDENQIKHLERDIRKVAGVVNVHNYLHLPGTPAPNKAGLLQT